MKMVVNFRVPLKMRNLLQKRILKDLALFTS